MKFTFALISSLLFCAISSNALPNPNAKTTQTDDNKLDSTAIQEGGKVKQKDETKGVGDKKKTEDENLLIKYSSLLDNAIGSSRQSQDIKIKKCTDIVCAPPPSDDGNCETSNDPALNVMSSLMGPLSDCCLLWICTRPDGSFFTHYGITSIGGKAPGFEKFATSFSSHFNHGVSRSNYNQMNPFSTVGGYPTLANLGAFSSDATRRPHGQQITAAAGFTGQYLAPSFPPIPTFPQFPFDMIPNWNTAPQPQMQSQPTFSAWGTSRSDGDGERERRNSGISPPKAPQFQQNSDQIRIIRQVPQENFGRYPAQPASFFGY